MLGFFVEPAQAASVQFRTMKITAPQGMALAVTPEQLPSITLSEGKGKSVIGLAYRNLPAGAGIKIVKANGEVYDGKWMATVGTTTFAGNIALPASLARGVYTFRAFDTKGTSIIAESPTFRSSGSQISLVSSGHRTGTLHVLIGKQSYEQILGLTREKAKRACKAEERANDDEMVTCIWNGDSI